jgi:hypothetical protein
MADPSPRVRRAWKLVGTLVAVPALLFVAAQVASALAHEQRTEVTTVAAAGLRRVVIDNAAGSIRVVGVEGADAVTVTARISDGWRATGHGVRRDGDRLVVEGSCPVFPSTWCGVRHTIEVPSGLAVVARADDGTVMLTDLAADVEASSDNGRVELARIEGDVRASSDNGSVSATGLRSARVDARSRNGRVAVELVAPPRSVLATSHNGSVDVVVPDTDDLYRVEADTRNGAVSTPVRQDPDSDRTITVTSRDGDVTVAYALG